MSDDGTSVTTSATAKTASQSKHCCNACVTRSKARFTQVVGVADGVHASAGNEEDGWLWFTSNQIKINIWRHLDLPADSRRYR